MEALETAATNRISNSAALPGEVAVLSWSDKPLKVSISSGNTAAIVVRFMGVQLQPTTSPSRGRLVQAGTIELEARFFTKTLREGNGAYGLMAFVQQSLSNWLPGVSELDQGYSSDLPGLQLTDAQLIGNDKALWDWGQVYTCPVTFTMRSSS
ncbi:hypothetical protein D0962_17795 [Leptolyngbyaceae cyanobacterium CCMR0082]|uniref:Uncharacterized protein n=1 Tax=Adonisia turfae CCMR0082 TaxID=2304604 RepID=A0A6M0S828_9CYAN|nr:hypothetical protein [Adonisia turfae CCMR0082]